jgi:hypothetical protein
MAFKHAVAPFAAAAVLLGAPGFAQADNFDRARQWMAQRFQNTRNVSARPAMHRRRAPQQVAVGRSSTPRPHHGPASVRVYSPKESKSAIALRAITRGVAEPVVLIQREYVVQWRFRMH